MKKMASKKDVEDDLIWSVVKDLEKRVKALEDWKKLVTNDGK